MSSISLPGEKIDAKSNVGGSTPTMVVGFLLRVMVRPRTPGSPPKRLFQKPWLRMTAPGPSHAHSSAVKFRPWRSWMPSTGMKLSETPTPRSLSGSPAPLRVSRP